MRTMKMAAAALAAVSMAGCVSMAHPLGANEPFDAAQAYVVVRPYLEVDGSRPEMVYLTVKQVTRDGTGKVVSLPLENGRLQVLPLEPGAWFVSGIAAGQLGYTWKPIASTFHVRPGVLTYPGDWYINITEERISPVLNMVAYGAHLTPMDESVQVERLCAEQFPKVCPQLPVVRSGRIVQNRY